MTQTPGYKPLRRSRSNRMVAGVNAGIAQYFGIDPVAARVLFVVLAVVTGGAALLAYLVAWIVMPEEEPVPYYAPMADSQTVR